MSVIFVNVVLLLFLVITALAINQQRNLFAAVMMSGIYSLICASLFVCLDAVDVAFTEAAVGAGIATILFLGTLAVTSYEEKRVVKVHFTSLFLVFICGGLLIYGLSDIPAFGEHSNPVQTYLADAYVNTSFEVIGVPNLVTSVLASFRGFDILGETTVIFTAGISVLMLLGRGKPKGQSVVQEEIK